MKKTVRKVILLIGVAAGFAIFISARGDRTTQDSIAAQVDSLVDRATLDAHSEKDSFTALVATGEAGVPFIIGHLGDMRPLPDRTISFVTNNQNVNETVTNFEAEVVQDALSIILQQITHQDIGSRYDGGSLEERNVEREKIRQQWINYCKAKYPRKVHYCDPNLR